MPIYEYKCKACNREFEYQQRMTEPDKTDCEVCGASALERLISATAFHLKGGGWYKDLYSSTKPDAKSSDSSTGSSAPAPDKGASSSSDASSSSSSGSSGSSGTSSSGTGGSTSGTGGGSSGSKAAASAS